MPLWGFRVSQKPFAKSVSAATSSQCSVTWAHSEMASFICTQSTEKNHCELELASSTRFECPFCTSHFWAPGHSGKSMTISL